MPHHIVESSRCVHSEKGPTSNARGIEASQSCFQPPIEHALRFKGENRTFLGYIIDNLPLLEEKAMRIKVEGGDLKKATIETVPQKRATMATPWRWRRRRNGIRRRRR